MQKNRLPRLLLVVSLLIALGTGMFAPRLERVEAKPLGQTAINVVISEFRFIGDGGGNDEFIELYNPTSIPFDISGWLIRGSNNAGTTGPRATIPNDTIIQPGQYYLIANNGYSGPVVPDWFYGTGITNDGGIALILPDGVTIIDQVGLSSGSTYKEGTPLTPLTTNVDRGYERRLGGTSDSCEDTGDNSADFQLINPSNPQNSNSPLSLCGVILPTLTPTSTPTNTTTPSLTFTPTLTFTPSNTSTITNTPTVTQTPTITPVTGPLSVLINEVAWSGTSSTRTNDEWIELHNTLSSSLNLDGWKITIDDGNSETDFVTFINTDNIPAGGFFLLARSTSGDFNIFTNVVEDKGFTTPLPNTGTIILRLYNAQGTFIDSANLGRQSGWYAGTAATTYASMERRGKILDGANAWFTFGGTPFAINRDTALVRGSPKQANWAVNVTPTATPFRTPTRTPTPSRVPTIVVIPRLVINEILARPGFDWNQDGKVDVFDEFIEIKNLGPVTEDLSGWQLDAVNAESAFVLPSVSLRPGERVVFYGSQTNLLLSDGGETVRLINPGRTIIDAYTYSFAGTPDRSFCRMPDREFFGSWFEDCIPTPNLVNTREGTVPSMPGGGYESLVCELPDTIPSDFLTAECRSYGTNIWNPYYWDRYGWLGWRMLQSNTSKWESYFE